MEGYEMKEFIEKCECYIHSLNRDGGGRLAEATILRRICDNHYVADYNGLKCLTTFNPFEGRYYVDDVYGVIPEAKPRIQGH